MLVYRVCTKPQQVLVRLLSSFFTVEKILHLLQTHSMVHESSDGYLSLKTAE